MRDCSSVIFIMRLHWFLEFGSSRMQFVKLAGQNLLEMLASCQADTQAGYKVLKYRDADTPECTDSVQSVRLMSTFLWGLCALIACCSYDIMSHL